MHHLDEVRNRHRGKEVVTGNFFSFARTHVLQSHRGDTRAGIGLLLSACRFPLAPSNVEGLAASRPLHPNNLRLHPYLSAALSHLIRHRLPHVPRPEFRIVEAGNEAWFALLLRLLKITAEK